MVQVARQWQKDDEAMLSHRQKRSVAVSSVPVLRRDRSASDSRNEVDALRCLSSSCCLESAYFCNTEMECASADVVGFALQSLRRIPCELSRSLNIRDLPVVKRSK